MHKRILSSAPFAALIFVTLVATKSEGKLETIEQIIPGVWFRQGDLDQFGHCNNIVIEMKDYLIVVDANYPSGARATMADIKKISSKPVKYVFDTHHHGDHAYGNPLWTEAGATTFASKGVAEEMRRLEPARWLADAARRKDVAELHRSTAEPPRQTFDKTPFVIEDSSRRVEFHFFGWAHTRGDGFAYLPKEQVLCTGDAVTNGPYNGMGDGYAANWPKVVRGKVSERDLRYRQEGNRRGPEARRPGDDEGWPTRYREIAALERSAALGWLLLPGPDQGHLRRDHTRKTAWRNYCREVSSSSSPDWR
jgi:glyoxylase-like metal-dependent hydrolase (beta-lactamase superfamily II)